ncbi:MAG: hypothetical protein GSR80_000340 [Desulfurococcales archaeon]|nr:hypothetical protein [Desulfurococcales archaeon]
MKAVVPLGADPSSPLAALSALYRVWEEYDVDSLLLLATTDAPSGVLEAVEAEASERLGLRVGVERVDAGVEGLGDGGDRLTSEVEGLLSSECGDGLVVVVSPAGRRLAAALALAGARLTECPVDVAHLHFYFGPWTGLPYPYTPRRLEPLVVMHRGLPGERGAARRGEAPGRARRLFDAHCRLPTGAELPPLRCAVGETARILNDSPGSTLLLPGKRRCGRLLVGIGGRSLGAADLCSERDAARLAGGIAAFLNELAEGASPIREAERLRQSLAWTGLAHLEAHTPPRAPRAYRGPFHGVASSGAPVIVDTTLIYYGVHRYAWEGGRILVPECAVVEVHSSWAEAAKRGRLESGRDAAAAQAYMGLADLLGAGASIIPAPAGKCDVSIPKAEPVILDNSYIATADDGAYRYWVSHPASRLATPLKVSFDPYKASRQEVDPTRDPRGLSRLYYALTQALVLLALLDRNGLVEGLELEIENPDGSTRSVRIPAGSLQSRLYA